MIEESSFGRIIEGNGGAPSSAARGLLSVAAKLYGLGVSLRNRRYDARGAQTVLPCPVISVGNITVGGTGKTPLVIDLVNRLERMGRTPAVVSRGYGAAEGEPNDEELVIRRNCPSVVCLADRNRGRAGELACQRFGADCIVLDDGFQHRGLARSLDVVAIDATCPFGYGFLLPRGLLREPTYALRRAHLIVLTRCDQVAPADLSRIQQRLRKIAVEAVIVKSNHRVNGIERLDGTPFEDAIAGRRAVLFAGIGRPRAFATTVRSLGVEVVAHRWWPDHHRYTPRDLDSLISAPGLPGHDLLLTTEKDAAKLAALDAYSDAPILTVKVAIDFLDGGGTIISKILKDAVAPVDSA